MAERRKIHRDARGRITSAHTGPQMDHDPTETRVNRGSLAALARDTAETREATTHDAAKDIAKRKRRKLENEDAY